MPCCGLLIELPHPSTCVKVNVDAAVRSFLLGVFAEKIASFDPLVAEGSALLAYIDFAVSRDWTYVVLRVIAKLPISS